MQLSYQKYCQLQGFLQLTQHQKTLASRLGVNQSTISRELKKCKELGVPYSADLARNLRKEKRRIANKNIHTKITLGSNIHSYIETGLEKTLSPEQISLRLKKEKQVKICYNTIYKFLFENLYEKVLMLRHKGKKYQKRYYKKIKILNRTSIHDRPKTAEKRKEIGHYEADTIIGKNRKDKIVTVVDRKSRYLFTDLIKNQKIGSMSINVSTSIFQMLRNVVSKSITFDNGTEFSDHEYLTEMMGLKTFFADPYSSWQRGTNEYHNRLIREFIPKGSNFQDLTNEKLQEYTNIINHRPRKCLKGKTPYEVFWGTKERIFD